MRTHIAFDIYAWAYMHRRMTYTPTRFEALKLVRDRFATQQEMADHFGVTQPTVWRWLNQSKQLPAEYVLRAEACTGVSRHWLRPDIYPADLPPAGRFFGVDQTLEAVSFQTQRVSKRRAAA